MEKDRVLVDRRKLDAYVKKCADQISQDHYDESRPVVLLGVLNGAMPFLVNLSMKISKHPVKIDTVKVESYTGMFKKGKVKMTKKPSLDLNNSVVIVVDDIVDTGDTMNFLNEFLLKKYKNITIKTCSLFKRKSCENRVDYLGRVVDDGLWLYGYGLDNDQFDRNLPRVMVKTVKQK